MPVPREVTRADYTNYLKHDPIYHKMKAETEERYCWVRQLDGWTTSSNLLVRLCGKVALLFAMAHDYLKREETEDQINFYTAAKYYEIVSKDPSLSANALNRYRFVHHDPKQTAVLLSMMHGSSFKNVKEEAQQRIKEETGLNVILQEDANMVGTDLTGSSFNLHYIIQIEKDGELISLGKMRVDGAYRDYDSQTGIGSITFTPKYNRDALADAQKQTESFNYRIGTPAFKKYVKSADLSHRELANYKFTREAIKSSYHIDCDLLLTEPPESNEYDSGSVKNLICTYEMIDPKSGKSIGTIKTEGFFCFGLDLWDIQPRHAKIDFTATFNNCLELEKLQQDQYHDRMRSAVSEWLGDIE